MRMSVLCQNGTCPAREYQLSFKTAQLETGYQKTISQLENLMNEEVARKLRVECQIFETDNELLKIQCERLDHDVVEFAETQDNLNRQLLLARDEIKSLQSSLRATSRTLEGLKGDLNSKTHKAADYEHILADRLALSRELSALKQEVDRLKSQNSSHQALIAEKQSLERHLNSLEVQIEDERRAFQRNKQIDSNGRSEAQYQLESLQEELKKEVEGRLRLEKEGQEKSVAWENQKKSLEERLQTVRKQLRSAKDKLKEYRQSSHNPILLSKPNQTRQSGSIDRDSSLGHSGATFDPDMTIATPGAVRIAADVKRQLAVPGEKSAFSITPYLNRKRNTAGSPTSSDDDLQLGVDQHHVEKEQRVSMNSTHAERPDEDQITRHKNQRTAHDSEISPETSRAANRREKSANDDALLPSKTGGTRPTQIGASSKNPPLDGKQNQRKRKILGGQREKTLFDDEEEQLERPLKDRRVTSNLTSRIQPFHIARQTFNETSTFSPLKRDKRLV